MTASPNPPPLRFVLVGAGFWARYQLAAWSEQPSAECVAVVDTDPARAQTLAQTANVPHVFDDLKTALFSTRPDFVDIVTPVDTHAPLARLCSENGVACICQKPFAPTLAEAEAMVARAERAGTNLLVHENWRWQTPLRTAGQMLQAGQIGKPFRARLSFVCSFPVFANQPALAELEQFIVTDMGSHLLDTARFLFGEAQSVFCTTRRVNPSIRGEDVATAVMPMRRGSAEGDDTTVITVICEMSYASATERERFPQTYLFVEGESGSLEIGPDYVLRVTSAAGPHDAHPATICRYPPPRYAWADPAYDVVQAAMVPCQADLLAHLRGEKTAETTGADNLKTVQLVQAAYTSSQTGQVVPIAHHDAAKEPK